MSAITPLSYTPYMGRKYLLQKRLVLDGVLCSQDRTWCQMIDYNDGYVPGGKEALRATEVVWLSEPTLATREAYIQQEGDSVLLSQVSVGFALCVRVPPASERNRI